MLALFLSSSPRSPPSCVLQQRKVLRNFAWQFHYVSKYVNTTAITKVQDIVFEMVLMWFHEPWPALGFPTAGFTLRGPQKRPQNIYLEFVMKKSDTGTSFYRLQIIILPMAQTYSSTTVFEVRLRPSQPHDSHLGPLHKKLVGMTAKEIM